MEPSNSFTAGWTITEKLAERGQQRTIWQSEFAQNLNAFSKQVSDSITRDVFAKFKECLDNPYNQVASSSNPLSLTYSFDVTQQKECQQIKTWAHDAATLAPFAAWIAAFEKPAKQQVEIEVSSSIITVQANDPQCDKEYFRNKMAKIGRAVKELVNTNLITYQTAANNQALKFKVEWHRKAEHILSNPSDFRDNYLKITLWIDQLPASNAAATQALAGAPASKSWPQCVLL